MSKYKLVHMTDLTFFVRAIEIDCNTIQSSIENLFQSNHKFPCILLSLKKKHQKCTL